MSSLVVQIDDGKLKGVEWEIANGEKVLAFLGIPYAKPPVGDLRFKSPVPVEPWEGTRDAGKDGNACISKDFLKPTIVGSEDCLFINVYTKSIQSEQLRPVMVFIHGGAFISGSNSGNFYNPDYLLMEDVVLVVINYRVGIVGFLNLDDPTLEIPGNAGLKDQTLALKWVQKNIGHFGGDSHNVTIFGESAGSASVHYHVLSSTSKGLFHKGILQSGTVHNPWPYGTAKLLDVLKVNGVEVENEKRGLEYLTTLSSQDLYKLQQVYMTATNSLLRVFGPVVEKSNPTAFLSEEPADIISSGNYNQVPLLIGYCDKEGMIFEAEEFSVMLGQSESEKPSFEKQIAIYLGLSEDSALCKDLIKKIDEFYIASGMDNGRIMLTSDLLFIAGIITSAKMHAANSTAPVYLYRLSIQTELNIFKKFMKNDNVAGASHGDDLGYLFRAQLDPSIPKRQLVKGSIEEISVIRIVKMWTNFARYSNPTPSESDVGIIWTPMEKNSANFLSIDSTLTMRSEPEPERVPLWKEVEELYKAYNIKISGS